MMKTLMRPFLLVVLLATGFLSGCKKDSDVFPALVGSWKLTKLECYCARTPVPNQTVTFTATDFKFYLDGQLTDSGTYASATITPCGTTAPTRVLRLKYHDGKPPRDFLSTVESQFLRLDSGLDNKCIADAGVVYTYERL